MREFPVDAPVGRVRRAFEILGFELVREGNHISMAREASDGVRTTLTMPNHPRMKASTLRTILTQARIPRDEFMRAYDESK